MAGKAKVKMISGCKDEQTSGDVKDVASFGLPSHVGPGGAGGACTNSMMKCLQELHRAELQAGTYSWCKLLVDMREILSAKKFSQIPQLSASYMVNLNEPISIKPPNARRTRALLIGINYVGHQQGVLDGCHNDVRVMSQFIASQGFSNNPQDMKILMDDGRSEMPTKQNIMNGFKWLTQGAQPGDALFLHYSGHGSQVKDVSGDEKSGFDQTMVPVDYRTAGQILDDDIFEIIVAPLPDGVSMFCVMDCCHSGSIMDLPYEITVTPEMLMAVQAGQAVKMKKNKSFFEKKKNLAKLAAMGAAGAVGCAAGPVGCMAAMCAAGFFLFRNDISAKANGVNQNQATV